MIKENSKIDFFVPKVSDSESWYETIKRFVTSQGFDISDERVYSIEFTYKGNRVIETVGELSPSNGEPVYAIFENGDTFYTCTPNNGVLRGEPLTISGVEKTVYFDYLV